MGHCRCDKQEIPRQTLHAIPHLFQTDPHSYDLPTPSLLPPLLSCQSFPTSSTFFFSVNSPSVYLLSHLVQPKLLLCHSVSLPLPFRLLSRRLYSALTHLQRTSHSSSSTRYIGHESLHRAVAVAWHWCASHPDGWTCQQYRIGLQQFQYFYSVSSSATSSSGDSWSTDPFHTQSVPQCVSNCCMLQYNWNSYCTMQMHYHHSIAAHNSRYFCAPRHHHVVQTTIALLYLICGTQYPDQVA